MKCTYWGTIRNLEYDLETCIQYLNEIFRELKIEKNPESNEGTKVTK